MSDDKPRSDAYRSGQVYAVLEVLRRLGGVPGGPRFGDEDVRRNASRRPLHVMAEPFLMLGKCYGWARRKDRVAADTLLRSLPDLMPLATKGDPFPGSLTDDQQAGFLQGRLDQLEAIAEKTGVR
ncbi:hypothetical protein [uncultured Streptomyces sp.]|uniref:hypothetical protein n=1 Tax=uncultured Streptomyces sp. TaxID=174707 RepID=UPI00260AF7CF|nr:hypothetical protein [uncultured Streptomyces sp.]